MDPFLVKTTYTRPSPSPSPSPSEFQTPFQVRHAAQQNNMNSVSRGSKYGILGLCVTYETYQNISCLSAQRVVLVPWTLSVRGVPCRVSDLEAGEQTCAEAVELTYVVDAVKKFVRARVGNGVGLPRHHGQHVCDS